MRIAVIGSGAVGCYYGAKLLKVSHDVHFLMRRDLEAVRARGLRVFSADGDLRFDHVQAHARPEEIGPADLVICALKATAIDAAAELVRPCIGPHSRLVVMMNGLGIEEHFATWVAPQRIFGGLAFVCINRGEPGVVHHLGYGRLVIGHFQDDVDQADQIAAIYREAGLDVQVRPSLRQARWEKLMWNIPFSTLAITAGGITTDEILNDPGLRDLAEKLIIETGRAGNADGSHIDVEAMAARMLANTATMGAYRPSMLVDYEQKSPLEVDAILGEPVRRAQALGVSVPYIETQFHLTAYLDRRNRRIPR
jgi:2-dehydropantoate 2-reductase